jgi:hypothetical protein
MGATIALLAAANAPVAAVVSFYGGSVRSARWPGIAPGIELAAGICAPWIGFYGDLDKSIPVNTSNSFGPHPKQPLCPPRSFGTRAPRTLLPSIPQNEGTRPAMHETPGREPGPSSPSTCTDHQSQGQLDKYQPSAPSEEDRCGPSPA